jgi:hypothetical protein
MQIEIHYADGEDQAALYVDGQLHRDKHGRPAISRVDYVEETVFELLKVKRVYDSAFKRGGDGREGFAETLDQVIEFATERDQKLAEAARLEERAAQLRAQAADLKRSAKL